MENVLGNNLINLEMYYLDLLKCYQSLQVSHMGRFPYVVSSPLIISQIPPILWNFYTITTLYDNQHNLELVDKLGHCPEIRQKGKTKMRGKIKKEKEQW